METIRSAAICGSWVAFGTFVMQACSRDDFLLTVALLSYLSFVDIGYLGQILGLLTTTASRSCVICSLHCVFVAVVAELVRVSRSPLTGSGSREIAMFDSKRLGPAALAVAGVALVELQGAAGAPTIGDALSFAQPIGFGMGYLQLEELMRRRPEAALPISAIKLVIVALASLCIFELGPLFEIGASSGDTQLFWAPRLPDFGAILASPVALGGVLYTGLVTTALALWIESIAFARVPATDASIILTTEPLFAAAFGAISLGETFGTSDYVGASLIIGACVLAALLDNPGEKECMVVEDPSCEPPRKRPFWGF
jgi:drug/metabolite transporter (DMT)-like permease